MSTETSVLTPTEKELVTMTVSVSLHVCTPMMIVMLAETFRGRYRMRSSGIMIISDVTYAEFTNLVYLYQSNLRQGSLHLVQKPALHEDIMLTAK